MAARQPLYNEGSAVRTQPGQAQLASIPGRGVSIDSGALMAAVEAPQLDVEGAAAVGRGYAKLGQNIAALGEPFVQLAEEQAKMYNANRVSDARNMLSAARDEIAVAQEQEPDEMKWEEITKRIGGQAVEKVYGMNLSPAARDEIDSIVKGWNVQMEGGTRLASARKTRNDFEADQNARLDFARKTGDRAMSDSIIHQKRDMGLITDGQASLELFNNGKAQEDFEKGQKAALATEKQEYLFASLDIKSPEEIRADMNSAGFFEGVDPTDVEAMRTRVESAISRRQAGSFDAVISGIYSDDPATQITTEAQIDAINDKYITDEDKRRAKQELRHIRDPFVKAFYEKNSPRIAAELSVAASEYDPVKDEADNEGRRVRYYELSQQIARLPAGMRADVVRVLRDKAYPGEKKDERSIFNDGDTLLKKTLANFNAYKGVSIFEGDAASEGVMSDEEKTRQADLRRSSMVQYTQAREEWRKWVAEHPDKTVLGETSAKALREIELKWMREGATEEIQVAPPVARQMLNPVDVSDVSESVDDIISQYGGPESEILPVAEGPDAYLPEGNEPLPPTRDRSSEENTGNILLDTPPPNPYGGFDGEGTVPLTNDRLKRLKKLGKKEIVVWDSKTKQWAQIPIDKADAEKHLIIP